MPGEPFGAERRLTGTGRPRRVCGRCELSGNGLGLGAWGVLVRERSPSPQGAEGATWAQERPTRAGQGPRGARRRLAGGMCRPGETGLSLTTPAQAGTAAQQRLRLSGWDFFD